MYATLFKPWYPASRRARSSSSAEISAPRTEAVGPTAAAGEVEDVLAAEEGRTLSEV